MYIYIYHRYVNFIDIYIYIYIRTYVVLTSVYPKSHNASILSLLYTYVE